MATVYRARDGELERPVAVKVLAEHLADTPDFHDRFLREARLAAQLSHPNIVQVFDVGEDDGRPFIVMECVEGATLADELKERGRLDPAKVVDLALQICGGLEHAHAAGLVHRDIKPQNLLLRADGTVKIQRPTRAANRAAEGGGRWRGDDDCAATKLKLVEVSRDVGFIQQTAVSPGADKWVVFHRFYSGFVLVCWVRSTLM